MASNLTVKSVIRNRLVQVAVLLVLAIVVFYAGYQLAIYQTSSSGSNVIQADEPVINLYPTQPETVRVRLNFAPGFRRTVPTYSSNGWTVVAQPDGTLTDLTTGTTYPYLIWEGNPTTALHVDMSRGFVVPSDATQPFLEQKLATIGLSSREIDAFITYWLPRLQPNHYNLIHFDETAYTSIAQLHITPTPDALLRVFMVYRPLSSPLPISPQSFSHFDRHGFTAVEWGGAELQ